MTSKINRKDIIGPLTDEQANHVWQILHDADELMAHGRPDYDFTETLSFIYKYNRWCLYPLRPTISYESFVAKMSTYNPKWLNTKWDVRNWTKDQKRAFQEECFRCGYRWVEGSKVSFLGATAYSIRKNGTMGYWIGTPKNFDALYYGTEKKWEDMFPNGSSELGQAPSQEPQSQDHECWLYYSHTQDCCLKCHPEKDLRQQQQIWGILDTARRDRELIEEVKKGRK